MDAHPSHEIAFSATLTPRQRRLAGRLEGFGDIVFGFAVSQCALQLPTSNGHVSIAHPFALLLYFGTFGLVATLWFTYHRMLSSTYVPSGIDLFIAFAFLALVSLIPYAMYSITHAPATLEAARVVVAAYTVLYAAMTLLASLLCIRNLRRGYFYMDAEDRNLVWLSFLRQSLLFLMMVGALAIDRFFGPSWAGLELAFIFPVIRVARIFFSNVPSPEALRVAPVEDRPTPQQDMR